MALLAITTAISAGIQRNVEISEMKHSAKLEDTKLSLASAALTRMESHAKRLAEARVNHYAWVNSLKPGEKQCYDESLADLQASIAPKAS
jgi:hypothetical protein